MSLMLLYSTVLYTYIFFSIHIWRWRIQNQFYIHINFFCLPLFWSLFACVSINIPSTKKWWILFKYLSKLILLCSPRILWYTLGIAGTHGDNNIMFHILSCSRTYYRELQLAYHCVQTTISFTDLVRREVVV